MNITKEQADKVIAALSMNRIMARDENGNYTKEITAQVVVEALSIMRGLADAEPVNRCITELLAFAKDHPGTYIFPSWDGSRVMKYLATSPQAAQTEAALCEMVRLSEDAGLYDSDFQAGRAGRKG